MNVICETILLLHVYVLFLKIDYEILINYIFNNDEFFNFYRIKVSLVCTK